MKSLPLIIATVTLSLGSAAYALSDNGTSLAQEMGKRSRSGGRTGSGGKGTGTCPNGTTSIELQSPQSVGSSSLAQEMGKRSRSGGRTGSGGKGTGTCPNQ